MADPDPGRPDPWQQALDGYRSTAKWIIGGFAAVGAALAGTTVLGNLGNLDWSNDKGRIIIAAIAAATGLLVVVLAVFAAAEVLAPRRVTIRTLKTHAPKELSEMVRDDPNIRTSLKDFIARYERAQTAGIETSEPQGTSAVSEGEKDEVDQLMMRVIDLAKVEAMRETFDAMRWKIGACALAAGVALATFSWAANPPSPNVVTTTKTDSTTTVAGSTTTATTTSTTTPSTTEP